MGDKVMTDLQKDLDTEQAFQDSGAHNFGMESELSLLIKVYNEQLEQLVKLRVDLETSTHLMLMEPNEKSHLESKVKTERMLAVRKIIVSVIRAQMMEMFQWKKDHKKV